MQTTEDGLQSFGKKGLELIVRNKKLFPRSIILEESFRDTDFYLSLILLEIELRQFLAEVRETMRLAGLETDESARIIYLNSKMNVNLGITDSQAIIEDLSKLNMLNDSPEEIKKSKLPN